MTTIDPHGITVIGDSFLNPNLSFDLVFAGGKITINGKTGKVTLKNIEPDEAAKEFWKAVENHFPGHSQSVNPQQHATA